LCTRYRHNLCVYRTVLGVNEFKYATETFNGAKGVAMVTKFRQKNKPKLHWFQFWARNRGIYHIINRFSGSANSNMVYKISWESARLPWQPNLVKKNCTHQFSARNREILRMYSGYFGVGQFQYAIRIFKKAKGVAMSTKFEQKEAMPKSQWIQFCARNRGIFHIIKWFSGSANSNMAYKDSRVSGRLPWQPQTFE